MKHSISITNASFIFLKNIDINQPFQILKFYILLKRRDKYKNISAIENCKEKNTILLIAYMYYRLSQFYN